MQAAAANAVRFQFLKTKPFLFKTLIQNISFWSSSSVLIYRHNPSNMIGGRNCKNILVCTNLYRCYFVLFCRSRCTSANVSISDKLIQSELISWKRFLQYSRCTADVYRTDRFVSILDLLSFFTAFSDFGNIILRTEQWYILAAASASSEILGGICTQIRDHTYRSISAISIPSYSCCARRIVFCGKFGSGCFLL